MRKINKIISFLICGTIAAVSPMYTASAESLKLNVSELSDNTKGARWGTYILWSYNSSETSSRSYKQAIYDINVKYDSEKFGNSDPSTVFSTSSEIIRSVDCILNNADGSYTRPNIVGFEPKQVDALYLEFVKNGVYTFYATSSTGTTAKSTLDVVEVSDPRDPSDTTPPVITIKNTSSSNIFNIESNELCSLKIGDKIYSECTGVNFTAPSDGVYTVTAADINGNESMASFTVGGEMPVTTAPPVTTLIPTTTTAEPTTTTAEPTTTTAEPTTTTAEPTTTTTVAITTVPNNYSIVQPDADQLYAGNTVALKITSPDGNQPVVYWMESSDYSKASSQDGQNISLYAAGTVTLTAHCANDITVSITLNIRDAGSVVTTVSPVTTEAVRTTVTPAVTTSPQTTEPSAPAYTLGDVNADGLIDASDASDVLTEYSRLSTGHAPTITGTKKLAADVTHDTNIDANDASAILSYYSAVSTGKTPSWD